MLRFTIFAFFCAALANSATATSTKSKCLKGSIDAENNFIKAYGKEIHSSKSAIDELITCTLYDHLHDCPGDQQNDRLNCIIAELEKCTDLCDNETYLLNDLISKIEDEIAKLNATGTCTIKSHPDSCILHKDLIKNACHSNANPNDCKPPPKAHSNNGLHKGQARRRRDASGSGPSGSSSESSGSSSGSSSSSEDGDTCSSTDRNNFATILFFGLCGSDQIHWGDFPLSQIICTSLPGNADEICTNLDKLIHELEEFILNHLKETAACIATISENNYAKIAHCFN